MKRESCIDATFTYWLLRNLILITAQLLHTVTVLVFVIRVDGFLLLHLLSSGTKVVCDDNNYFLTILVTVF